MYEMCDITCTISAQIPGADPQKKTAAKNIQAAWADEWHTPSAAELKRAAQLAQEGYLSSVKNLWISQYSDISEIPSDNMAKLSSIVTDRVDIRDMTPESQLGAILASVQSKRISLGYMSLSEENTRALVTAMSRVQRVALDGGVTLDPEILATYDGQGHCTKLAVFRDTKDKYGPRLREWAGDRGWRVKWDADVLLWMQRQ